LKGARPLTNDEILLVAGQFSGTFKIRNHSLFMIGVSVGGRISELLALTVGDVWQNDKPVSDLLFQKGIVKGKDTSRIIPVNADGRSAIAALIAWHLKRYSNHSTVRPLFPSRQGEGSLSREQAHRILAGAFGRAGLNGQLATHSLRKSFAQRAYDKSGDIYLVQAMLGHLCIETTCEYLGVSYRKMQDIVEQMETTAECNKTHKPLHWQKMPAVEELPDDTILIQAIKRGLIDPKAITQGDCKITANDDGKIIPMALPRKADSGRFSS
jgi:site-specific recombinase XerD